MPATKKQMSIFEFGRKLIETGDLDPVYTICHHCDWEYDYQEYNFLLSYWCFYHVGTASWISQDHKEFWPRLCEASATSFYPRSSERRHWRGQASIKASLELRSLRLTPYQLIKGLGEPKEAPTLPTVMSRVKNLRGFGDWIAFKVADMMERLALCNVQFEPSDIFLIFDAPAKGADAMWLREARGLAITNPPESIPMWAYDMLKAELGYLKAPPRFERFINIQEIETILCKWKSHLNGHYEIGKDIAEVRHGLLKFAKCSLSQKLLKAGKAGGLW